MEPPSTKKRKIKAPLPKVIEFLWKSHYKMEGKILSSEELGDGVTSRVYVGSTVSGNKVAVKRLKGYFVAYAHTLVDTYKKLVILKSHHFLV